MMISEGFDGKEQRADFIQNVVKKVEWDCLLTSYEQIVKEAPRLKRINFRYLIVDEAHRLKVSPLNSQNCVIYHKWFLSPLKLLI